MHGFSPPVEKWRDAQAWDPDRSLLWARHPTNGKIYDASISKYVDDIAKLFAIPDNLATTVGYKVQRNLEDFTEAIAPDGFAQNESKAEAGVKLVGPGSMEQRRMLYDGRCKVAGRITDSARFLGGLLNIEFRRAPEVIHQEDRGHAGRLLH